MARYEFHHEDDIWWVEHEAPTEFGFVASADSLSELLRIVAEYTVEERKRAPLKAGGLLTT